MRRTVQPCNDFFVRYLLAEESNKDLLLSFINAVHEDYGYPLIETVEVKNPFNLKKHQDDKESVIDVKATDNNGTQYDIEVQIDGRRVFKNRSLYYWSKLYSSQLDDENETLQYEDLKPTICINLVNFKAIKDLNQTHSCFGLKEMKHPEIVLTTHLLIHYLELPKFTKHEDFRSQFDKWLAFFKYEGKEELIMKAVFQDDPIMKKAHRQFKKFTKSEQLMDEYEGRIKYRLDHNSRMYAAKEEGLQQGLQQGLEQGLAQGSKDTALETAKKMIAKGFSIKDICEITGLSVEVIEGL